MALPSRARLLYASIGMMLIAMLAPAWARRAPAGFARPPYHIKGHATARPASVLYAQTIRHAYGFDQIANWGAGQVIGIVDAFDDPRIESDLAVFSAGFHLPACTTANGCFQKVYASGGRPITSPSWGLEIALDVEWAHTIAPQAKILLVEASSNSLLALFRAVDVAVANGASIVSMSWGGTEFFFESIFDTHFAVNGVTFIAAAGDSGNGAEYPASSPFVIGVGGTTLTVDGARNYVGETAWSGSGGGQSAYETEPGYQASFPIPNDPNGKRGIPDVAYDADPNTGFPVYDTLRLQGQAGWFVVGGTSAGAPQWAGLIAIANSLRAAAGKAALSSSSTSLSPIYDAASANYSANLHDITSGTNGSCGTLCTAATGYDFVTGLGSPQANNIIPTLVNQ